MFLETKMKDRFDLEDEITSLYAFADQLSSVSEGLLEEILTTDEAVNAIEGIVVLLKLHSQKTYDTMCQCLKLNDYNE